MVFKLLSIEKKKQNYLYWVYNEKDRYDRLEKMRMNTEFNKVLEWMISIMIIKENKSMDTYSFINIVIEYWD